MADNDRTRFRLDLPGFELEIAGERRFVENLYREVSQDILPHVFPSTSAPEPSNEVTQVTEVPPPEGYTWVYGVTQYYSKVYAVPDTEIRRGLLGSYVNPSRIRRIYVARDNNDLFTRLAGQQKTLWAEFTTEGRQRFQAGD